MREYREDHGSRDSYPYTDGWTPVVLGIVVANVIAYVALYVAVKTKVAAPGEILDWLAFVPDKFAHGGRWWQVVSHAFLHDLQNPFHLLLNMYMLWLGGRELELAYGRLRFLRFYLAAAAVGALVYLGATVPFGDDSQLPMLGASGAVMAVLVVHAFQHPGDRMLLIFLFEVPTWLGVAVLVGLDAMMTFRLTPGHGLAAACHLGGVAFGLLYHRIESHAEVAIERLPAREREPEPPRQARSIPLRPARSLEDELDLVLQKVHEGGMASLTPDEKAVLDRASKHYREQKP